MTTRQRIGDRFRVRTITGELVEVAKTGRNEADLLSRFRWVGAGTILLVIVVYVAASVFQLPGLRPDAQLEPTALGILVGAFCVLVGVEALNRIPGIGRKNGDE